MAITSRKTNLRAIALITISSILFAFFLGELYVRYKKRIIIASNQLDKGMLTYDQLLGWKLSKNWSGKHHHYDFDVEYSTNEYGFRGDFDIAPNSGSEKVAFVGDSFTFSVGVDNKKTFIHLLNQNSQRGDSFLNFGVTGYSTDQELLLIKERVFQFSPKRLILVVFLGNDLFDNKLPFPLQAKNSKPYYEFTSGELLLKNYPVPRTTKPQVQSPDELSSLVLGNFRPSGILYQGSKVSALFGLLYQKFYSNESLSKDAAYEKRFSNHLELFYALIEEIKLQCSSKNTHFNIALLAGSSFVYRPDSPSALFQDYFRKKIIHKSRQIDIPIIDLAGVLKQVSTQRKRKLLYHPNDRHLTEEGHQVVSKFIQNWLAAERQP